MILMRLIRLRGRLRGFDDQGVARYNDSRFRLDSEC
jgi:hypothetical protein